MNKQGGTAKPKKKPMTDKNFSWDVWKNEQKKISLSAWTQFYHKPYECDWLRAHNMALAKKWQIRSNADE